MSLANQSMLRSSAPQGMMEKDPARQFEWHESYRDMQKNMYRTTYTDNSHFRETFVKSDYPAGYGGHIPSIRHDVLHRNAEFDRKRECMRQDPSRDAHPTFIDQLAGLPTYTKNPCGAHTHPRHKVSYHDGTTTPLAPWGVTSKPVRAALNQRSMPPTMKRAMSQPNFTGGNDMARQNSAAMSAAAYNQPRTPTQQRPNGGNLTPGSDRLRHTVDAANEYAQQGRFPTEQEILNEQMGN